MAENEQNATGRSGGSATGRTVSKETPATEHCAPAAPSAQQGGTPGISIEDRLQDAQDDALRLHADKMRFFERTIELERALATANAEVERLSSLVYVPGVWVCAKCGLRLISSTLNASTGQISANKSPQDCPNKCGPLWRLTERDAGNRLCDDIDKMHSEIERQRGSAREAVMEAARICATVKSRYTGDHFEINDAMDAIRAYADSLPGKVAGGDGEGSDKRGQPCA